MLGNTRVQNCSSSDGNVGQYSCSKLFFERRKCWEKLVLLSEIFRTQMLGNTCVLERVFRTQMLSNSCVPEQGFGGRKKVHSPPPPPPPLLFPCMIFLLLKDSLFQSLLIVIAAQATCCLAAQNLSPMLYNSAVIFAGPWRSMSSCMFVFSIQYCLSPCKGRERYCTFQHLSWTESIQLSMVYSLLVWFPCMASQMHNKSINLVYSLLVWFPCMASQMHNKSINLGL